MPREMMMMMVMVASLNDFGCGIRFLVPDFISHGVFPIISQVSAEMLHLFYYFLTAQIHTCFGINCMLYFIKITREKELENKKKY